jgi:hypothetical protein
MKETNGLYEYIVDYVEGLLIASMDPGTIVQTLQEVHKFKILGVGALSYHLKCEYLCDNK